jgi:galactonate dehydratase
VKITAVESLHADAGARTFDFLKLSTDEGLTGWSEYNESFGGVGIAAIIDGLAPLVVGADPRAFEALVGRLQAARRPASGGAVQQAIGAIENAALDVKARALGVPVYELFGGPVRDRIDLYWSHCGMYRVLWSDVMQIPPLRDLDDVRALGREVSARGFRALKANILLLGEPPGVHAPGFGGRGDFPALNATREVIAELRRQMAAFREGAGPDVEIAVDLNFNFRTEGFLAVARALECEHLLWLELDTRDPAALRFIREQARIPIASCEALFGRREFRPFLELEAVDTAIVDVIMNGFVESLKIAAMAEAYEVNVAPHNFYGPLATLMSAHFCATVPNLRIMEFDVDKVPWHDELVTSAPTVEQGRLLLPSEPGWGAEINEEVIRAHPARASLSGS